MKSGISAQSDLSSKEQQLISVIESGTQNQRKIAESTGFSLGMTNILLKRLVQKGYIKVVAMNGRTLRYILTPRGFKEKLDRSFDFFVNSIKYLNEIRDRILMLLEKHPDVEMIYVLGKNELSEIVIDALRHAQVSYVDLAEGEVQESMSGKDTLIFVCDIDSDLGKTDDPYFFRLIRPEDFLS